VNLVMRFPHPWVWAIASLMPTALAYIPASPVNVTSDHQHHFENDTVLSYLTLKWQPMGVYSEQVSFLLEANGSEGNDEGALVHFSDKNLANATTSTPWVAFISCDANVTGTPMDEDIFTLAQERGAVAALLYSMWSDTCMINPEYLDPDEFSPILDIFSAKSLSSSRLISSQFTNINQTLYSDYDPVRLNASAASVQAALGQNITNSTYLVAVIRSGNDTDTSDSGNSTDSSGVGDSSKQPSGPTTGLAMIILYAITGCVSLLFCVVILSGAIRAIRHPERYGPRAADPTMGGPAGLAQSRTGGLTRAILDTFPVIKFGHAPDVPHDGAGKFVDPEHLPDAVQLRELSRGESTSTIAERSLSDNNPNMEGSGRHLRINFDFGAGEEFPPMTPLSHPGSQSTFGQVGSATPPLDELAAMGHDTCPICIVDFEEGDDLRVLPCEGKHRFHRDCVDPWLLESSGSCPLCREDFHGLEAGDQDDLYEEAPPSPSHGGTSAPTSRLAKYLSFARRRRRSTRQQQVPIFPDGDETSAHSHDEQPTNAAPSEGQTDERS